MATWGAAGGTQMATREPSSRRASRIGAAGRIEAEGPRNLNGRPFQRSPIEPGRGVLPDLSPAFDPDVSGTVNHDLADVLIFEDRFQARQKRAQVVHAASVPIRRAHIFPASTALQ